MTQISEPQAFELIRRLLQSAVEYKADLILCMCPMCQLNLDAYQGAGRTSYFGVKFQHADHLLHADAWAWPSGWTWTSSGFGKEYRGRPSRCAWRQERKRGSGSGTMQAGSRQHLVLSPSDEWRSIMAEKVGVYVCHCGSNIAGTVDVEDVAKWAGENLKDVAVARDYKFMCSSLGQAMIEEDIKKQKLTRVVVAACSPHLHEKTFRRACQNAGMNPYLFEMTQRPRARLVGHQGQGGGHGQGQGPGLGGRRAGQAAAAAGADVRQGQAGHAGHRRRHRRLAGHARAGRRRLPRLPRRARAEHRRPHGPVRQDLPHAGLLGLHPHAEDVRGRAARERHPADLLRAGGGQRLGGQLQGQDPQEGPLRQARSSAPAAGSAARSARARWSTTSSRRAWATARRSTRPSRRPCRGSR